MVGEQIQNYVNLVAGLRRATKAKASEAAQGLLSATGLDDVAADASERVSILAEEILAASRANRELLVTLINTEVDKASARLGFARTEDVDLLRGEVAALRILLTEQSARAETAEAAATAATAVATAAAVVAEEAAVSAEEIGSTPQPSTKTAPTKNAPAKKAPARKSTATKTPVKKVPATKAAAKGAPAAHTGAKKSTAKKRTAKKTPVEQRATTKKADATPEAAATAGGRRSPGKTVPAPTTAPADR